MTVILHVFDTSIVLNNFNLTHWLHLETKSPEPLAATALTHGSNAKYRLLKQTRYPTAAD